MKKIKLIISSLIITAVASSCSDMLETESSRQVFDPTLDAKTDSIFYTVGILQAMQQLADQYVVTGEMRGDLVKTTNYTETALREMANFTAGTSNKYDSAYVYYKVINNCNYYIAHRDTALLTGSRKVSMPEYVEAKAIRAWAYLQLAKNYGKVPFFTTPITSIAEVNANYPEKDIAGICDALAPDLAQYTGSQYSVPSYGSIDCGTTNWGGSKSVSSSLCMIPVDVILGDLYLESNKYDLAAKYYYSYLLNNSKNAEPYYLDFFSLVNYQNVPSDFRSITLSGTDWSSIFMLNGTSDIISYIPMAVNMLKGKTSKLPTLFGYDFYSTTSSDYNQEPQIEPSSTYDALCSAQDYYYIPTGSSDNSNIKATNSGDLRKPAEVISETEDGSTYTYVTKFNSANILLYRTTTIYLRLAEALNRMGYPDAAFAILKDGLKEDLATDTTYITSATKTLLTTTLPFFSNTNASIFDDNYGIHSHGCGRTSGTFSPYQMDTIVGKKMSEIASKFGVEITNTKADTINAVEDLICDEYALELAFEGNRFGDLCRLARHKNAAATYSSNFGGDWLAKKLAFKNPAINLADESKWYLPFK